jgi:hypothetical protein
MNEDLAPLFSTLPKVRWMKLAVDRYKNKWNNIFYNIS